MIKHPCIACLNEQNAYFRNRPPPTLERLSGQLAEGRCGLAFPADKQESCRETSCLALVALMIHRKRGSLRGHPGSDTVLCNTGCEGCWPDGYSDRKKLWIQLEALLCNGGRALCILNLFWHIVFQCSFISSSLIPSFKLWKLATLTTTLGSLRGKYAIPFSDGSHLPPHLNLFCLRTPELICLVRIAFFFLFYT